MKKLIFILIITYCGGAMAYNVCGPDVIGRDYAYSTGYHGTWAVGDGCGGGAEATNMDVKTMCTNVIVGGESLCASLVNYTWPAIELDEATANLGNHCYCRRTYMQSIDLSSLNSSIGQWVMLGSSGTCPNDCARLCAETIINNMNGLRNAIMMLPKIVQ